MFVLNRVVTGLAVIAAAASWANSSARADVILYDTLNSQGTCNGKCGPGPSYGTIELDQASTGAPVVFTVTLEPGATFTHSGVMDAFSFSFLSASTGIIASSLPSGFAIDPNPSSTNNSPFGIFTYGIQFKPNTGGPNTLTFDLADTGIYRQETLV